jgi:UDP-2,3-diacylglucosamine pyrophosphatase LpxH
VIRGDVLLFNDKPKVPNARAFHQTYTIKDEERSTRYTTHYIEISLTGECVICGHFREDHSDILSLNPCLDCSCGSFHGKRRPSAIMGVMW